MMWKNQKMKHIKLFIKQAVSLSHLIDYNKHIVPTVPKHRSM